MRSWKWAWSLVAASCATTPRTPGTTHKDELQPRWSEACPLLKRSVTAESSIMFSPWTAPAKRTDTPPVAPWTIIFGDVAISFPPGQYEVLPARNDRGDDVSVVLLDHAGIAASFIRMPPSEPIRDVFARAGGTVRPTGDEEAFTRRLFGGKLPTSLDLLKIAYRHFPSDLTCNDTAVIGELPIAIGLALKGLGPRNAATLTVHEDLYGLRGITYLGKRKGASNQWDLETHFETARASYIVGFTWKSREKMDEQIGNILLKQCNKTCEPIGPPWLHALGSAVATPLVRGVWQRLAAELGQGPKVSTRTDRAIKRLIASGK